MLSHTYPVRLVCRVLGYTRSLYYYRPRAGDDALLQGAIIRLAEAWPTYGYRRITALLQREGWQVNRKHVARLMRAMGLQGHAPARHVRTTQSAHPYPRYPNLVQELTIVRPDQVWVGDITYVRLREEFVYLAVLMDVYTRRIRGWHLSRQLDQALTLTALRRALAQHRPEIHHSDQGGPVCRDGVYCDLTGRRSPNQYGYRRRAHREWLCRAPDAYHQGRGSDPS
jgi:putative transposase